MRRQPSARRYLMARLRPLTRPVFWAPAIVLMLVMLFTWEFWTRPEFLSYLGLQTSVKTAENTLSAEDRAIGADIDTLPLLLNDVGISASPTPSEAAKSGAAQFTDLAKLQGIPIAGSTSDQAQTPAGLFGNLSNSPDPLQRFTLPSSATKPEGQQPSTSNQILFGSAIQQQNFSASNLSQTPSPLPQSPLQAALTKSTASPTAENRPLLTPSSFTSTPVLGAPIEGTTNLGSFGVNATVPNNASAVNSFTTLVEGSQPLSGSENGLSGVAPSIPPAIVPSVPSGAILINPNQGISTQGLGASPDAFAPQSSVEAIPPNNVPLSAPRPIPGRFIGGGQINTFSNP